MHIVSIINQKGGCGKTTTAINLAALLGQNGLRTLLVDLDPQSHCSAGLGIPEHRIELDIADALLAGKASGFDYTRLIWRAGRNLDLIPSTMKLAGLEASRGGLADKPDKDRRLAGVMGELADGYDIALIDCSPSIGLLTYNALTAASAVLVPVETGFFSLQGATKQIQTVRTLGGRLGVQVPAWLLATIHDPESELANDLLAELNRRFSDRVAPITIRRDAKLKEAVSFGQPVFEYAPESTGCADYTRLAEWVQRQLPLTRGFGVAAKLRAGELTVGESATFDDGFDTALAESPRQFRPQPQRELAAQSTAPFGTAPASIASAIPAGRTAARVGGLSRAEEMALRAQRLTRRDRVGAEGQDTGYANGQVHAPAAMPPMNGVMPYGTGSGMEAKPYGVRLTPQGVRFSQPISVGRDVAIAGDFNNWSPATSPLVRNEAAGVYEAVLQLPPGRRTYRVVVDGHWSADPFNNDVELNPFGEANSVVTV